MVYMNNENKKSEKKSEDLLGDIERFDRISSDPLVEKSMRSHKHSIIVIIDPDPADNKFYESFFPGNKFIKTRSHSEGVKHASKAITDGTISAIIIDDSIEGGMAPMLVSLFKTLAKKMNSEINIFVTYKGSINIRRYSVRPDVTINKDSGEFDIFY